MVRGNKWNKQLDTSGRLQSGLGRVKEVYKEPASSFVMATVAKVNYLYNSVDVVTINYSERIMKDASTQGRFSAQLPVGFGGSFTDGTVYGQTTPINIGDMVLVGFVGQDKDNPIVLNIYKTPEVSYTLAPTDAVSGNPEDSTLYDKVMEVFSVYPSQTYSWTSGDGTVEHTFQGRSFFKSTQPLTGNGKINDYGYNYDQLTRTYLRGQYLEPTIKNSPQVIYQHTGEDISFINNVFFDNNGDMRISTISKLDNTRIGLYTTGTSDIGLRYQDGDNEHGSEQASSVADIGIHDGIPGITYGKHGISFDNDNGLLVDGKPLSEWTGGDADGRITTLEEEVKKLSDEIDELDIDEISSRLNTITDQVSDLSKEVSGMADTITQYDAQIATAIKTSEDASALASQVFKTISDAAGNDASLLARLDRIDGVISSMTDIIAEVTNARTYSETPKTYANLGERLDTIELMTRTDNQRLSDLIDKLDIFLSDDFSKGVPSYVVTIQAYGDVVMRNGQGTVTLDANLYKGGFSWNGLVDDGAFVWTRTSDDKEGDAVWNSNNNQGKKSITLTGADFGYSAIFTVSVTVQGHLIES